MDHTIHIILTPRIFLFSHTHLVHITYHLIKLVRKVDKAHKFLFRSRILFQNIYQQHM